MDRCGDISDIICDHIVDTVSGEPARRKTDGKRCDSGFCGGLSLYPCKQDDPDGESDGAADQLRHHAADRFSDAVCIRLFENGAETLSYIKILMSVGMMTGAALLPKLGKIKTPAIVVAAGVIMGAALIEMSIAQSLSSLALKMGILTLSMVSIGFGGGLLNVVIGSSVMKAVPKEMMGRISGFLAALMQASMPVASFICSALAVYFHIPHILVFFGSMTLLCYLALYFRKKLDALS